MTVLRTLLTGILLFCFYPEVETNLAEAQTSVLIEGRVVYPDGSAADGAKVVVVTDCANTTVHYVQETTANSEGKFSIKSFDPTCSKYKFSVSHRENFWLETGENIFYLYPNGTTPTIELVSGQKPAPILLRLEQLGGEVELKVFDGKTQAFIYAGLSIDREPVAKKTFGGGMSVSTGVDGSSSTLFLPPGNYVVSVDRYMCHGKNFFAANPPTFHFSITAGIHQTMNMSVNIADIQTKFSYDNPKAVKCSQ